MCLGEIFWGERRWGGKGKISKAFKGTGREVREGGEKKKGEGRGGEGRRGESHGRLFHFFHPKNDIFLGISLEIQRSRDLHLSRIISTTTTPVEERW